MTRTARCECGQLSITVPDTPRGVGVCHCFACQRRTGSVFAALAAFDPPWSVAGVATEYLRIGDREGTRITFRFCPVCGTNLFHTEAENEGVSVAIGAFADPAFAPPEVSVYDSRRHEWVRLPDGATRFETDPR